MCGRSLHNSSMSLSFLNQQPQVRRQNSCKNTTVNSLCITNEPYTTRSEAEASSSTPTDFELTNLLHDKKKYINKKMRQH